MPINAFDVYRRLITLLLVFPRMGAAERPTAEPINLRALRRLGLLSRDSPIVGVALSQGERDLEVSVFTTREVAGLAQTLSASRFAPGIPIRSLVTGSIRPSGRPAVGGESLGEGKTKGSSGTFGCLVEDAFGSQFLLSCSHVLADLNTGKLGLTPAWQPSAKDGGSASDRIGVLHDFKPIILGCLIPNYIDAGLVKPDSLADVTAGLKGKVAIAGTAPSINYGAPVEKVGWKTKRTKGTYLYKLGFVQKFPGHGDALFVNQLGIVGKTAVFSSDGDSGAIVVNGSNQAVGIIMGDAPDVNMSFASPIDDVFSHFGVTPV